MRTRSERLGGRDEHGAVVVEFAAVFVVFVTLLAGLITYGMVFAVQQSLTHASAEAARSAIGTDTREAAETRMESVVQEQLTWLGDVPRPSVRWHPCEPGDSAAEEDCVTVGLSYSGHLLGLFPFQIAVPSELDASATLQHDLEE